MTFDANFFLQLLFSKCMSGNWPNYPMLGERCAMAAQAVDKGQDISSMQTTGQSFKAVRKPKQPGMGATGQSFNAAQPPAEK